MGRAFSGFLVFAFVVYLFCLPCELVSWNGRHSTKLSSANWDAVSKNPDKDLPQKDSTERVLADREELVFITATGKKFHRHDCVYLAKSAIEMTHSQALALGYQPCKRCNPTALVPSYAPKNGEGQKDDQNARGIVPRLPQPSKLIPVNLVRVIDGDTCEVEIANSHGRSSERVRVRLIGIDTPEIGWGKPSEPLAEEAREFLRKIITGRQLFLEPDVQTHDRYGRFLAYLWVQDVMKQQIELVNARLISAGLAELMTIPPNVKYADYFLAVRRAKRDSVRKL